VEIRSRTVGGRCCAFSAASFLNGIITSIGGCVHLDNRLVLNEGNLLSQG